jgi:hypothetical protein
VVAAALILMNLPVPAPKDRPNEDSR